MTNSNENFNGLIKDKTILQAVTNLGITKPTEIQIKTIPLILDGKNIIAESATGTGKTIAFLAGILPSVSKQKVVQALIIVPTRELANQVFEETRKISAVKGLSSCAVYGGESVSDQARQLRFADIVIGTPGRILDQMARNNLKLNDVRFLILDEADRMCDMGFSEDISKIIDKMPKKRQTLMFSATITKDVSGIERKYIPNAERVSVESKVDPANLLQEYYVVKPNQKFSLLLHLIKENKKKSIVFCNTRSEVDILYNNFVKNGVECFKLHGGLEQRKRTHTIGKYHSHKDAVLISSDVSARGIHVDNLEYIYNYDLPRDDTQYVHRIGRTARAGKKGKAIIILNEKEEFTFIKLCRHFGFKANRMDMPAITQVTIDRSKGSKETGGSRGNSRGGSNRPKDFFNKQLDFLNKSGVSGDRDSRGPPRDRDSRGPPRDDAPLEFSKGPRDTTRNSEFPRGNFSRPSKPAREVEKKFGEIYAKGFPNTINFKGPPRDRDSRGPPRDAKLLSPEAEKKQRFFKKSREGALKHKKN